MALFCVKTNDTPSVRQWFKDTEKRCDEEHLIKNPFHWSLKVITSQKNLLWVCDVQPIFFNFSVFGWVMAVGVLLVWGINWFVLPGIILGCLGYFWSNDFFYQMTRIALKKKAKYDGPIKRVKLDQLIREVIL